MTALHSKALKKGIYRKASPMEALMARHSMASALLDLGLHCVLADHGSQQREMLTSLAYLIGVGAEVAIAVPVAGQNRPALHQALQAVVAMACDGHRWDAGWGAQLSLATEISIDLFCTYRQLALRFEPGARELSQAVMNGTVRLDAIAPLHLPAANLPSGKETMATA